MGTLKVNGNIIADGNISATSFLGNASSSDYSSISNRLESTSTFNVNSLQYLCSSDAFDLGSWGYHIVLNHGGGDY